MDRVAFGDFQTPPALAAEVCRVLAARGIAPRAIVEPTCGTGGLLVAALDAFPGAAHALGADVNASYLRRARAAIGARPGVRVELARQSFFDADWPAQLAALPEPLLVIGNPPWVTSAALGRRASDNLPPKASDGLAGLDALTGKSNFDISEWMLSRLLAWLDGRGAALAMLCKTAVARKALAFAWQRGLRVARADVYRIDAARWFGAAVDACLLVCELGAAAGEPRCRTYADLDGRAPGAFGLRDGALVADVAAYDRWRELRGEGPYTWRSGVKHDCAAVMELRRAGEAFVNRAGETVRLEPTFVFPMLKSAELARGGALAPSRYMIVPQRAVGAPTDGLATAAPRTWRYLQRHRARFERRASSIYRGKPAFSVFGVGAYTFAPWKVAIAGLGKQLAFRVLGPHDGTPVVLDDTCYFVACRARAEARLVAELLDSPPAQAFLAAQTFWDAKRPITAELLRRLDLRAVARVLGRAGALDQSRGGRNS